MPFKINGSTTSSDGLNLPSGLLVRLGPEIFTLVFCPPAGWEPGAARGRAGRIGRGSIRAPGLPARPSHLYPTRVAGTTPPVVLASLPVSPLRCLGGGFGGYLRAAVSLFHCQTFLGRVRRFRSIGEGK